MSEATARTLSINRKKRGVVHASITRLRHGLANVEGQVPPDPIEIRRLTTRLQTLAAEFKVHHYAIIELLDDETALETEQDTLNAHAVLPLPSYFSVTHDEMEKRFGIYKGHSPGS